jgi:hypothetical protein
MTQKEVKASVKASAKAVTAALTAARRLVKNELNYAKLSINCARSGNFACKVTARATLGAFLNLQEFLKKNSSSQDEKLKPLLEEVRKFLGEFNQGSFSSEFCTIWNLAGRPMTLIVLH